MEVEDLYRLFLESNGVSTDSRTVRQGELYFALKGLNFDGNAKAKEALDRGALYAIVDDPLVVHDGSFVLVNDVLTSLQYLANWHRTQLTIPVLGITGSNGKTTTKELINKVVGTNLNVACTKGNYNNHIGLPLTILNADRDAEFLILEMGSNESGNIKELCDIGIPSLGLVTNVGIAHIEKLGSQEGVFQEKSVLLDAVLERQGVVFLNIEDPWLQDYEYSSSAVCLPYSSHKIAKYDLIVQESDLDFGLHLLLTGGEEEYHIHSHLAGSYNIGNIAAAIAVGLYLKLSIRDIVEGISSYRPENMRSQLVKGKRNSLLLDAYNANPSSMKVSVEAFVKGRKEQSVLIIGDMLELGSEALKYHDEILSLRALEQVNRVIVVGKLFVEASKGKGLEAYYTVDELLEAGVLNEIKDKHILIKGSRGIKLERIVECL